MKFQLSVAALAAIASAASVDVNKRDTPLSIKLESVGNSEVKIAVTNNGEKALNLLSKGTFLDEVAPVEKVQVYSAAGSKKVPFEGIKLRLLTTGLANEDFIALKAGETKEVTVEAAALHSLNDGGDFDVFASGVIPYAEENSTELSGTLPYDSEKLTISVDGAQAARVNKALDLSKRTSVRSSCTGTKLTSVKTALTNCNKLATSAASAASAGTKLDTYFKSTAASTKTTVSGRLTAIARDCGSTTATTTTNCDDQYSGCSSNVLAYTVPSTSYITYCPIFFSALPALSTTCHGQDQATTVLHEEAHANSVYSPGTDDLGYGFTAASRLTTAQALNNADSFALLAPIIILSAIAEMASRNYIRGRSCYPNGLWREAAGATWRIMDSTYFFTPNLSFGNMTFTQVKVIDVAWDLVVGRGGQMGLAWVNWVVFNEWMTYHLERWRTSYKMYTTVALQTTSWTMLGVSAKEFLCFGGRTWDRFFRWIAMFCLFISTIYVLAFPTLMAAMTGYITTYEPYMEDFDRNLIEWEKVEDVVGIVQDAERLNLGYEKPLLVVREDEEVYAAWQNYLNITDRRMSGDDGSTYLSTDTPTTWNMGNQSVDLPAPSLNLTQPIHDTPLRDLNEPLQRYYAIGGRQGTLYNSSYVRTHSSCKPSETYQWGFSYIFLFMVSIFNFIWSVIMVCMWFDTRRASRMYKSGRRPGLLRSVLDLSAAVREELGVDAEHLEEEEIRKRLTSSGGGLCIPKDELRVSRVGNEGVSTRKRTWTGKLTRGSTF
ncbi:hypothetical protein OPT61_g17 [Boeremia exigua]|uniref:Uncharacterized protein n=1 Tax=Boeremia exigua TaxID=749465 RepID=A0ACC2IVB5_9PLEO|nr:hypothetical protein OPT61_g17 [Boeremia exigua]